MGGGRTTEEPTVLAELRRVAGECETPAGSGGFENIIDSERFEAEASGLSRKTAAAMKPSEGHQQCHEVLLSSGDGGAGCLFFNLACWLGWGVKTV